MKIRSTRGGWGLTELLPIVILSCFAIIFFLAGYFGSMLLLSQDIITGSIRPRSVLESVADKRRQESFVIPHGDTGDSFVSKIPFQVLSWKPRVVYFPGFATAEQCQNIIRVAKNATLKPSMVASLGRNTDEDNKQGARTSTGTFLHASEDNTGTLDLIEQKIARATMLPRTHGEPFNVLRYEIGQRYLSHHDSFDPDYFGPRWSQRVASFLLYLSDVEEGGETSFPLENGSNMNAKNYEDIEKCIGLKVKPRQGDGLLFYSLYPNGTIDRFSLHASCPVIAGEKWVATKWINNQVMMNTRGR